MVPFILASTSPRRHELLAQIGLPFTIQTAPVEELTPLTTPEFSPEQLAVANAQLKANSVVKTLTEPCWVLGADTIVALNQHLMGKPESLAQAAEFLALLSGQTHEVITGLALIDPEQNEQVWQITSRVTFQTLTPEIIARYLEEVPVLDKAGAYALQHRAEWIIDRVEGSRSNIIGLPLESLREILHARGLI